MMAPGNMNIRRIGFAMPQRYAWGIPPVQEGDWLAERTGQLVAIRQPWEVSPIVRVPALGDSLVDTITGVITGTQEELEQGIADRAANSVMEAARPYIIWGALGVIGLMALAGFAGYSMGKGA